VVLFRLVRRRRAFLVLFGQERQHFREQPPLLVRRERSDQESIENNDPEEQLSFFTCQRGNVVSREWQSLEVSTPGLTNRRSRQRARDRGAHGRRRCAASPS
jgi:hypothetical protein